MAGSIADYLENALLEHSTGKTTYTKPTTTYLALYTATPSDAGGGTEVSGGSYARTAVTWGTASGGSISNSADITFPTATGSWGTVTQVGLFDASTVGNLLWWGDLAASKTIANGDVFKVSTGNLTLTLS